MVECVILIGLPASGKSSFYRDRFASTHDLISKDLLRNSRRSEIRQQELLVQSLAAGRSVVVDNTNVTVLGRARLIALARQHGARTTGYYFDTNPANALRRNRMREGNARVPDVAIFTLRKRMEPPSLDEGFDELWAARLDDAKGIFEVARL